MEIKGEECPYCENVGLYISCNCSSLPWESEQVQCEFCYTNPNSIFNLSRNASVATGTIL